MNNSLQRDVDTLAHLLKENREDVSNELLKYSDEESFMRMQLMLREYFKKEKKRLQQEIEREAQLILTIFPGVDVENLKELLQEAGDHPNRSKVVIKQLSSKNGIKRAGNKSKDEHPFNIKMNNSLQRDADTLAHLLKENREDVSNELLKYSDEESFMRMQLMLREYFKKEKKRLQQEIEREAQLILTIFPNVDVENLKELLQEAGDHPNRSKVVIKQLSSKNGIKRAGNKSKDEHPISKKFKRDVIVIKEDDAVICVDDDDATPKRIIRVEVSWDPKTKAKKKTNLVQPALNDLLKLTSYQYFKEIKSV